MQVILLRAWIKEQIRWISRQLPWQLRLVNELWLLTALLVLAVAYSTYWGFSLLGGLREFIADPTPLLHIPGFARYLEGYLLIALVFLTVTSFLHFAQFFFPFPEPLFLFTSPVSRWKIYGTRLIYALLLNLVLFSVGSLPPLVMIGIWAGEGIWLYFTLLPIVGMSTALAATAIGALLAAATASSVSSIPRLWRFLVRQGSYFPLAPLFVLYLILTSVLPRIPLFLLPRRLFFFSGWAAEPLVIATSAYPFTHWSTLILYLTLMLGTTVVLLGLFLFTYSRAGKRIYFQIAPATKPASARPILFGRRPLLRRELSFCRHCFAWSVVMAGGTVVGLAFMGPQMGGASAVDLPTIWFAGLIANCLVDDKQFLQLAHLAPLPAFSMIKSKFLALIIYVIAGSLTIIVVMGAYSGLSWEITLLFLTSLLIGGAFPLVAIGLLIETLFPFRRYGSFDVDPVLSCKLALSFITAFFWMGIATGFEESIEPFLAVAISTSLILAGILVSYFVLRLVARRLARMEWL